MFVPSRQPDLLSLCLTTGAMGKSDAAREEMFAGRAGGDA